MPKRKDTHVRVKIKSKEWIDQWTKDLMLPHKVNFLEELRKSTRMNKILEEERKKRLMRKLKRAGLK